MSVLICPFARRTWGHLIRCFALGDALVALGARVRFACPPETRHKVEDAGFELIEVVAMDRQPLLQPPRSRRLAATARRWLGEELATARECLRVHAPDAVVADLQPIFSVAAALEGIPSAAILNLELLASPLAWWLPGIERLLGELDVPGWAARRVFGDVLLIGDTATQTGLRDLPPDLVARITASVQELRFVGPILGPLPSRRPSERRPHPEVVVSLGGGGGDRLAEILAGCAGVDADFLVITAERSDELERAVEELRGAGRGVTLVEFLPDFALRIAEADALVTHGGHGTLSQALALAVPTLVIPATIEQEINAKRLHGIGAVGSPNRLVIRETVGAQLAGLLRDRTRDAARERIARGLTAYQGARDAAHLVWELARRRPAEAAW